MIWRTNQQLDREYADKFELWREQQVIEQLDHAGIGFMPKDES